MLPWIVLSPFLLMPVVAWLGKRPAAWAALLAAFPAALTVYFASLWRSVSDSGPVEVSLSWVDSLGLSLAFYADGLSLLFALLISAIGVLIVIFASKYLDGSAVSGRFQATLFGFMGSMLGVVLAANLITVFVFWELTGFTSFLLIGFEQDRKQARAAAIQAFLVTGLGGMALLAAAILIELTAGSSNFAALFSRADSLRASPAYPAIVVLLLLAAFTKSAQAPFHFWLPNAMAAPTPVSAYLHSATMVKAGIYLVARMTPILGMTELWSGLVITAGATTMALGAWRALGESDLKRILAYSTISALGILMLLLGVGSEAAVTAALVYLTAHACYKGALFLVAGTIEHETGTRIVTELGGLRSSMPGTALAAALAALSMAGIPLLLGFVGKELLYEALLGHSAILILAIAASAALGLAGLIAGVSPFAGLERNAQSKHAVPLALAAPPLILSAASLAFGMWPAVVDPFIRLAGAAVTRSAPHGRLALWHGFTPLLALSMFTLAAAFLAYSWRDSIRDRIWPKSLGFERLYHVSLRTLDAISASSLPALQGGSLRSYARALVVFAGLLLVIVVVSNGMPAWPAMMDVRIYEAGAALMIVAGAISAALTSSTIKAVLSLGVTGYGVALLFLFFGAPDLAMTQFSVETLTAVIFVSVFYHFSGSSLLSPLPVRLRDALIAASFGGAIALVLLIVGAKETPSTVARYYAEHALPMAHGRNIVNVILVDFRALDTLGEITVLATAALGVRAVLRIGRGNEKRS